jgi:hypothetical protein
MARRRGRLFGENYSHLIPLPPVRVFSDYEPPVEYSKTFLRDLCPFGNDIPRQRSATLFDRLREEVLEF